MDKLFPPKSASTRNRSASDFKNSSLNAFTLREKKLRKLSQENDSKLLLDTTYIYKPEIHLPVTDTQEISMHLTILKKNFDKQCTEWNKRDSFLCGLKSEMDKITAVERRQSAYKEVKLLEVQSLKEEIIRAVQQQESEEANREIFLHLLDRMRTTIVHLKSKNHGYKTSLHKRSFSLITDKEVFKKTTESRVRTAHALSRLRNVIEGQRNEEVREVEELEKNVEKRKIVSTLREERRKKQEEIIEKAMIDSQSSSLEVLREKYFLNKLWYNLSTMRFNKEQLRFSKLEDAYLRIKLATGISDVPLFVSRFLTKEKNYRSTLNSVKQKEADLLKYQEKIAYMQNELERFNSNAGIATVDGHKSQVLSKLHKDLRELTVKKINIVHSHDKILRWLVRMREKLVANSDFIVEQRTEETGEGLYENAIAMKLAVTNLLKGVNKRDLVEAQKKKENLWEIINEIPEVNRNPKKYLSLIDHNDLISLDAEPVGEEIFKRTKKFKE